MPQTDQTTILSHDFKIDIPRSFCDANGWRAGQEFAFVPKGKSVLLVPVPSLNELRGITAGACVDGYRDREDRF